MSTLGRYLLLQLPGWVGVALVMMGLHVWLGVAAWIGVAVTAAWMAKDLLLFPWLRPAYDARGAGSPEAGLVGLGGTAEQPLDPVGFVRVRGELWRARVPSGAAPVERGTRVVVRDVDGMTLVVEGVESGPSRLAF